MVNRRTFRELALDPSLAGIERDAHGEPTGRLFLEANWTAQARFRKRIAPHAYRAASARAAQLALREGTVHLHAQLLELGSRDAYADEVAFLRTLPHVNVHPKICERDPELAASLGLSYVGGDVFLDGSLGSGTAALCAPYHDRVGCGNLILDDSAVYAYFGESERLGISAGVHAIGDRAIEQALATWERVLGGGPSSRCRHFIEHFELATPDQIARAGKLGLYLSVQPQFDATWGAPGSMYDARLTRERASTMNAFASAKAAGAVLCGGDDAPVCALSPLAGMRAACEHHRDTERIAPLDALTMYAYDAARLGFAESHTGRLAAGYDADLAILSHDPFADGAFAGVTVLETWSAGTRAFALGK
jgi:predicted amidohydrolase YtcJ